jgi:hypothetical protein
MLRSAILLTVALGAAVAAQQPRQPSRDTPAQQQDVAPAPSGLISGRVIASDSGRPVKRARVFVNAAELPGGRGALTDDNGIFALTDLPAGRYTLSVSKAGFVSLSYGQRRPLQPGTPLQLADGQQLKSVNFSLPRGSVIAGHVLDEDGEAMPGVVVQVMRYQYLQGDRRLTPAGTAQTDDKGQFRVWGLMPGEYYVNAQARLTLGGPGGPLGGGRGGPGPQGNVLSGIIGAAAQRFGGANMTSLFGPADEDQKAYAPTYFPGVTAIDEARPLTLGLSQELNTVDFNLQLVHVLRVAGHVSNADGTPTTNGNVSLATESNAGRVGLGQSFGSRIGGDGSFSISSVPPGRYTLTARGMNAKQPQFAAQPLAVGGTEDLANLSVILSEPATISGVVSFPATQAQPPDLTQVRITAPAAGAAQAAGPQSQARVEKDGTFIMEGLAPGPHLVRLNGALRGWSLQSVLLDGRDVTDTPLDLKPGQKLANVTITFTDKQTEIDGTITNELDQPVPEFTVLAFSTDSNYWQTQSRRIQTTRPDQTGKFKLRGLPAGAYYITTVDPAEQGEWFDPAYLEQHRLGAARVTLAEGDTKTQDFKVRTQN